MTSSARKAWNEAMKATAGIAALPVAIQEQVIIGSPQQQKRRSDRHRGKSGGGGRRATKAAKVLDHENDEYRTWVWVDALEGVDPSINATADDDDDFGDIVESPDHDDNKKRTKKSKTTSTSRSKQQKSESKLPKYLMPKSLGTILMDELNNRDDGGTTYAYLGAEAHVSRPTDKLIKRKFCPVTGLFAQYTHPKTGIPYSSLTALDQILERPPPWMTLANNNNSGSGATYLEALKSITQQE